MGMDAENIGLLAIRVDDWEEVEVVFVQERLHLSRVGIGQHVVGEVLNDLVPVSTDYALPYRLNAATHHGGDPLARVDGTVEDNSGLALARVAPEVNASDGAATV